MQLIFMVILCTIIVLRVLTMILLLCKSADSQDNTRLYSYEKMHQRDLGN